MAATQLYVTGNASANPSLRKSIADQEVIALQGLGFHASDASLNDVCIFFVVWSDESDLHAA